MRELEMFFDYSCPFCLRGHAALLELLPEFPDIQMIWRPCEAHPRPETYGKHSDLCIQGMFLARDQGADLMEYHARMYKAAVTDRVDIESASALACVVKGLLDENAFRASLERGEYAQEVLRGNDYAYEENGVWAVPAFRMEGRKLDAVEGVGVRKDQLREFLAK